MRQGAALAALLLASCGSQSSPPSISVHDAWARATVAGQNSAAIYLSITNKGGEGRLMAVSSPIGSASLHRTSMSGGVMRMRKLDELPIPPNATVELKPGATHVMVSGLQAPLAAGSRVPLTLAFAKAGKLQTEVAVRAAGAAM
ncbi:MAG TPA: copper chaperone PCu(A)C [Sphingomicrobium sp.]|nr:copper chaperone PCu(A)C [Sphingomicrobium sp.]